MKRLALLAFFLAIIVSASTALAQTTDVIEAGIDLSITPETPQANAPATARLYSSTADLDISTITWSVNGKTLESGKGIKNFSFTTGPSGSRTTVSAEVSSPVGVFIKSVTLTPNDVELLWQGSGYTPPFYKGKTLWGRQTRLTLVALAHVNASPASLIYRWTVDGEVVGTSSGLGKDTYSFSDSVLGIPKTVSVDVLTDRDTPVGSASITLAPSMPELHTYENNPLLGYVFEREAGNTFVLKGKEVTFTAFPFFFSTTRRANNNLTYNWSTNNGVAREGNEVTYRAPESSGKSSVSVNASSITQALQTARENFLVQFDNDSEI